MKALEMLARKLRPDLFATQLTGANETPLIPPSAPLDIPATAKAVLGLMRDTGLRTSVETPSSACESLSMKRSWL